MRHHEWILQKLKEERIMNTQLQEWEFDHSPNPDTTVCQHCGQVHISEASIEKEVWNGEEAITYYFCSTNCSHEFYLDRLREQL